MIFTPSTRRLGTVALGAATLGAAAATLATNPARAADIISAVTTVSCSVTGANWCISGNNSSSGIGVIGTSKSGTGLRGASTSQYGLKATSGSGTAIFAQTTSGPAAVNASGAPNGTGLLASGGIAVSGTGSTFGLQGYSTSGTGVQALSVGGRGLYAQNTDPTNAAITGVNMQASSGLAAYFQGNTGVSSASNNYTFVGSDSTNNYATTFVVDNLGDVTYTGTLKNLALVGHGATVRSFSAHSTQPTVEDTGTAQLVAGAAVVRFDPAFAASIEPTAAYRVFVTPNGDTRGLFVASKTAGGFVVRESQAGRSTVTFDYRIVATALGGSGQHMAILTAAAARAFAPTVPRPVSPTLKIPAGLPTPAAEPAAP